MNYWLERGYSRAAVLAGYAFALLYFIHSLITIKLPRTDKLLPMREELRGWHYLVGTLLLIAAIVILYRWWKDGKVSPGRLSPAAHRWTRILALFAYIMLAVTPLLGFVNAWTHDLDVHFGPLPAIPALMEKDRALWVLSGYFHSAPGFSMIILNLVTLLTGAYLLLRYGLGLVRAFPPGYGLLAFSAFGTTVYASTTFASPEPGPRAVAIYLAIVGGVWLLAKLLKRWPAAAAEGEAPGRAVPAFAAVLAPLFALVFIGIGLYGPAVIFRVNPFHMEPTVAAPEGVTSHQDTVTTVYVTPETEFERQVAAEDFKWCGFCHSFEKGADHILGPNLYGVFGREIASVPNFPYTDGFVATRAPGRVWTDELMAEFLYDPDKFAPGTSMVVSSGNVSDPEKMAVMINILKKKTMGDAVIVRAE